MIRPEENTMLKMAVGHSDSFEPVSAVTEALDQCRESLDGIEPQAALMFVGPDLDGPEIHKLVREAYPEIELIGSTTGGEMSSVLGYKEDSFGLAMLASDVLDFGAGIGTNVSQGARAACREAVEMAREKSTKHPALCITLPTIVSIDPDDVLAGISELLGESVPVVGGGAAVEDERASEWGGDYQFCGDEVLADAVPVLLISGPLVYSVGIAHGWQPTGREGVVTRARGNVVYEIDGAPPRDFYERYVRTDTGNALATPLAVYEDDGERFFLRAAVGFDDDGSASYLGAVPEGAHVRISAVASSDKILAGTDESVAAALADFALPEPEAALVVSCAARKWLLGTRTGAEIDQVRDKLGEDLPVVGFYAFGEIAPLGTNRDIRFHNETCVTVLLGT
ncbi:MAG: FIST N-terminal domain-containing protein [Acidimicrobiia bacterium]